MMENDLWIDTRLNEEEMNFLRDAISEEKKKVIDNSLPETYAKSEMIADKDNWFYETALKKLTEKLFYDDWNNYRRYHIVKEEPLPKFGLNRFWVNYLYQQEVNPLHNHGGLYSFVVFVKIPTHWEEQQWNYQTSKSRLGKENGRYRAWAASNFMFVWSEKGQSNRVEKQNFFLSSEDEGRMLFFPAWLQHQVFPFYGSKEDRITISGNIDFYEPNNPQEQEITSSEYEEKERTLRILENSIKVTKEELRVMKK